MGDGRFVWWCVRRPRPRDATTHTKQSSTAAAAAVTTATGAVADQPSISPTRSPSTNEEVPAHTGAAIAVAVSLSRFGERNAKPEKQPGNHLKDQRHRHLQRRTEPHTPASRRRHRRSRRWRDRRRRYCRGRRRSRCGRRSGHGHAPASSRTPDHTSPCPSALLRRSQRSPSSPSAGGRRSRGAGRRRRLRRQPARKMSLLACIRCWPSTTRWPCSRTALAVNSSSTEGCASLNCRNSGSARRGRASARSRRGCRRCRRPPPSARYRPAGTPPAEPAGRSAATAGRGVAARAAIPSRPPPRGPARAPGAVRSAAGQTRSAARPPPLG